MGDQGVNDGQDHITLESGNGSLGGVGVELRGRSRGCAAGTGDQEGVVGWGQT